MPLFTPATNTTAHLKVGLLGFEGSGKTFTAVDLAIGMTKLTKGHTVGFIDTEKGSDFFIDKFKKEKINLVRVKTRAFVDLIAAIDEAEKAQYSFLIIDSITHFWRELTAAWLKEKKRNFLTMKDWGVLKQEWAQFTTRYVDSKLNIAMLGRAGYEYDIGEDDDGKQEIVKSGTKMKVETETGFEPDLLLEMFKIRKSEQADAKGKRNKKAKGFTNACIILKDRTDTLNARTIIEPKFKDFMPVVNCFNIGGEHVGADTTRTSQGMFKEGSDKSWSEKNKQREIALEDLQNLLIKIGLDGRSAEVQKKRVELLERVFTTASKTKLEGFEPDFLRGGLLKIKAEFFPTAENALPPTSNNGSHDVPAFGQEIDF